ncbi:CART protein, partial [Baryphthengus martii]|nr:CART protein [Baryphthengus martii]
TGSMESAWLCLLYLASSGLILPGTAEPVLGLQPAESLPGQSREETELVEALQEVLEKLGSRELPAVEKRLSWVPLVRPGWGEGVMGAQPLRVLGLMGPILQCGPGEPCAVRRGARIGKLCSCPRGTTCNLFILKCS